MSGFSYDQKRRPEAGSVLQPAKRQNSSWEVIPIAERRMISKKIVESARFIRMPASSQNLYFHLLLNADDDGIVEAFAVMNLIRANEDDLRVLVGKGFVQVLSEELVSYIVDWREQNRLRADRKTDSIYKELLLRVNPGVELLEMKDRSDMKSKRTGEAVLDALPEEDEISEKSGPSMDGPWTAQCSVGEFSSDQSLVECEERKIRAHLGTETLTQESYEKITKDFPADTVDLVIRRILDRPYYNCLNEKTIRKWCKEQADYEKKHGTKKNKFHNFEQRRYDYGELEERLFNHRG